MSWADRLCLPKMVTTVAEWLTANITIENCCEVLRVACTIDAVGGEDEDMTDLLLTCQRFVVTHLSDVMTTNGSTAFVGWAEEAVMAVIDDASTECLQSDDLDGHHSPLLQPLMERVLAWAEVAHGRSYTLGELYVDVG